MDSADLNVNEMVNGVEHTFEKSAFMIGQWMGTLKETQVSTSHVFEIGKQGYDNQVSIPQSCNPQEYYG